MKSNCLPSVKSVPSVAKQSALSALQSATLSLNISMANLSPQDHKFLSVLLTTFTDPANNLMAACLRSGRFALQYDPRTGQPLTVDLDAENIVTDLRRRN